MSRNWARRLEKSIPGASLAPLRWISTAAHQSGTSAYLVGGVPRDLALSRIGFDFDIVVEGDAIALARSLAREHGGRVIAHARFGTATWSPDPKPESGRASRGRHSPEGWHFDLVTARKEHYHHPGALPTVARGTLNDDLARRDFTINTLAIRLDGLHFGEVYDHFGALEDLRRGRIRVLHPASFLDDPTRLYRAARYEQRYGLRISTDTRRLIPSARQGVRGLSAHRLRQELETILSEADAVAVIRRLSKLDLLRPIHPDLPDDPRAMRRLRKLLPSPGDLHPPLSLVNLRWHLWLLDLPAAKLGRIDARLHFSKRLLGSLRAASALYRRRREATAGKPSEIAARLDQYPETAVWAVQSALGASPTAAIFGRYLAEWRQVRTRVKGDDLRERGLTPGPIYKQILQELRNAMIDGEITTPAQERDRLEQMLVGLGKSQVARQSGAAVLGEGRK